MTRCFPESVVVNVWSLYLRVTSDSVLLSDQIHQVVVDEGSFWEHEHATWGQWVHIEELLLSTNVSVVSRSLLLKNLNMLVHFLLRWETDTVHSLETVIASFTQPVGT